MNLFQNSNVRFGNPVPNGFGLSTRTAKLPHQSLSRNLDATLKEALGLSNASNLRQRTKILCDISIEIGVKYLYNTMALDDDFLDDEDDMYNRGLNNKDVIRVRDSNRNGVLEMLSKHFGGNLKIKTQISNLQIPINGLASINLETPEEKVVCLSTYGTYGFEFYPTSDVIKHLRTYWCANGYNYHQYQGTVTVTVIPQDVYHDASVQDVLCIPRKMLKDEIACDVTIIPRNQVPIKCHKSFLCAHSSVLETMFQTQMKESKTNTVEMPDMSEQSVRAFLAYLYLWEVKEANKNCLIAFELLNAGHKYDIPKLEETMAKILLIKESGWYDVDVAMKLFLFARNRPEGNQLKMKAIQVLKANFAALEKSPNYQKLFQKDPKAAMELCKYAFST